MENKKKLNTDSNAYTLIYSVVIVVIVAFLLAFVFQALKDKQDANVALDKKKQILYALNIRNLDNEQAAETYQKVVLSDDVLDESGSVTEQGKPGSESVGFKLGNSDMKEGRLALYVCNIDGQTKYVIPVYGMGLWGGISGYIALNEDKQTVFGAYFNHESETAGLGAEIKDSQKWQEQFCNKKLFAEGDNSKVVLSVKKKSDVTDPTTQCDAVTGATLTSDGVSLMLTDCLNKYIKFLTAK